MVLGKMMKAAALSAVTLAGTAYANNVEFVPGEMIVKLKEGSSKSLFNLKSLGVELQRGISL